MAAILVLEDDRFLGDLISQSLVEAGHRPILCFDGDMAHEQLLQHKVELIIADLIIKKAGKPIPDGGISLISRLRQRSLLTDTYLPIIAISGITNYPGLRSALNAAKSVGADATLSKPFRPSELLELVERLLVEFAVGATAV